MSPESVFSRWRGNFFAGLAVVLPAMVSIAVLMWLFGTVAGFTDKLLFFLPDKWTHSAGGAGPVYWYWSVVAFVVTVVLIAVIGRAARHYIGKTLIEAGERVLLRIPLLNKIYGTVKQVNEALSSNKSAFKQVVLIPFPHPGTFSFGFITNEKPIVGTDGRSLLPIFIPTTPNPTSGFLILVPEKDVTKLDIPVSEGIRFIISIGAITPGQKTPTPVLPRQP